MPTARARVLRITISQELGQAAVQSRNAPNAKRKKTTPNALEIYELLELILLHLPMRDLLLAQRVCTRWNYVINSSQRIQRALHFFPIPYPDRRPPLFNLYKVNPLIADVFRGTFAFQRDGKSNIYIWYIMDKNGDYTSHTTLVLHGSVHNWHASMQYEFASWRRMLVTQPPVLGVELKDLRVAPDYDDCFEDKAEDEKGVRMGDLLVRDVTILKTG